MNTSTPSSANLFVATGCSHCPIVLNELSEQLKKGEIASLNVTNIAVDNKPAEQLNIRSVPWFSLENEHCYMIFNGSHSAKEIKQWVKKSQETQGMQDYIEEYLSTGQLMTIVQIIQLKPDMFNSIIAMLEDEETGMEIRIGLDALIENFTASELLKQNVEAFKKIASDNNPRLQIDALHYIALTADEKNNAFLLEMSEHENSQVKEAANEAIETLKDLLN